jgi:hypothetical protein
VQRLPSIFTPPVVAMAESGARPFSFGSEDGRRERDMAPGLRSHPVGTRNTLEDLGFPFARRLSSTSTLSSGSVRGPLGVVGGLPHRDSASPSLDSLTDPDFPFATRSPSLMEENGTQPLRPSITPSERISRVLRGRPSVTPSESVSRIQGRPSVTPSEALARLLGRKSGTATDPTTSASENTLSVVEIPVPAIARHRDSSGGGGSKTGSSVLSWPMPPGGARKGWVDLFKSKGGARGGSAEIQSRWSETQRDSSASRSRVASVVEAAGSREEITALPAMGEKR